MIYALGPFRLDTRWWAIVQGGRALGGHPRFCSLECGLWRQRGPALLNDLHEIPGCGI
jgi:hypothetical protein